MKALAIVIFIVFLWWFVLPAVLGMLAIKAWRVEDPDTYNLFGAGISPLNFKALSNASDAAANYKEIRLVSGKV
jgi:hypothetical protein